ncbi:MAG: phenylalanine--tRNA ligase subunit beta [Clostridia bacterium]|nr:phenylalanine--tRNA ligase subunit beta [Clostridia bacterium]
MKLSTNFVKDYVDIDENIDVHELAEKMTKAGNEYDEAEKLINATNLIIGEIKECEPHPDSDHLHLCKVDIGKEILDIVCGAPNARKGIKVIVAQVGAELPGDFKIKKGMIRGQESNGMLCALYEIGIDKKFLSEADKNGIHELPADAPVGEDPVKYMKLDDSIVDFELTANRGDLLSILGMAYELGAIYNKEVKPVEIDYKEIGEDVNKEFSTEIKTENCKLFLARKAKNVTIKESPDFIKNRLIASGIRPINNVVDISNYVMLELGQPLHFYDADNLGDKIVVRMAEKEEKLTTLDNIERTLTENDIVITDGKKSIGLAGVMGGLDTEVEETTKNIVIEAAIFDSVKVRMTSNKILRSESSNRFEKGLDPARTYMAMDRACTLLQKYADAEIVTGIVKYDVTDNKEKVIEITYKEINDVLGTNISKEDIIEVFRKLNFKTDAKDESVIVTVPTRRIDISIRADLIEEVGRIYGVDNIQGKLPIVPMRMGHLDKTTRKIRSKMSNMGLNETLSYILINDKDVHKFTTDEFEEVKLLDPITEERNTLRYSMIPSLYKIYEYNKARENKDVCLFEIGKGFWKKGEEYGENQKICVLMSGEYYTGIGYNKNVDFYNIKGVTEELLDYLGYAGRYSFVLPKNMPVEFHPGQTAEISVNNDIVGIIGRIHPSVEKEAVYVMEINLDKLLAKRVGKMKFKEISKFPTMKKDIAVLVSKDMTSKDVETLIKKKAGKLLLDIKVFDVYEGKNIDENKRSVAYSLTFGTPDRTLNDDEINSIFENIIKDLENKGIEIRK